MPVSEFHRSGISDIYISSIIRPTGLKSYVLTGLFAGIAIAAGYMLISVPNVEAITATLFLAGYTLGTERGILASLITVIVFFGLNPQGGMFPPLLLAQAFGLAIASVAGVIFSKLETLNKYVNLALILVLSLITTLLYDLLTNLAFPIAAGLNFKGILITLGAGIPFAIIHLVSNVLIFLALVPPVIMTLNKSLLSNR